MICFPNAKINLGVQISGLRADGLHTIETLLYPVPMHDALEFLPARTFQMKITGLKVHGTIKENLVYRGWELLHDQYGIPPVGVHLHKTIPVQSGLGGGSSDAAFFLRAANDFFNIGIDCTEMKKLAAKLGSDCPFFIGNKAAIARGAGEILSPAKLSLKGFHLLLLMPASGISTREAYSLVRPAKPRLPLAEIISRPVEQWKEYLKNDFEKPLFEKYPEIGELKNRLYGQGAVYASMTGSGTAVFGLFKKAPDLKNFGSIHYFWQGKLSGDL